MNTRKVDGIVILDLAGDLTLGFGHGRLRDEVNSLLRSGLNKIVVNLRRVSKIDAAGIGVLILALMRCRNSCGKAVLLHFDNSKVDTSDTLELDAQLQTFHTERDAIHRFFPNRAIQPYDILAFVQHERKRSRPDHQTKAQ